MAENPSKLPKLMFWLSSPSFEMIEIAAKTFHYRHIVLDIEHGTFDLTKLHEVIGICKALGMTVYAKVLGPQVEAIQQAADFGADAIIIPHVGDVAHAERVAAAARYPPAGSRSYSGTRPTGYGPAPEGYFGSQDKRIRCFPMIETPESLRDLDKILSLANVDGVFVGPSDLSLTQGRVPYTFSERDREDIAKIAGAARMAGKSWILPAWTEAERTFGKECRADGLVVTSQFRVFIEGLKVLGHRFQAEGLCSDDPDISS